MVSASAELGLQAPAIHVETPSRGRIQSWRTIQNATMPTAIAISTLASPSCLKPSEIITRGRGAATRRTTDRHAIRMPHVDGSAVNQRTARSLRIYFMPSRFEDLERNWRPPVFPLVGLNTLSFGPDNV